MPFITFSSDQLPASLDDATRFRAWQDRYMADHGHLEIARPGDRPFSLRFSFAQYGDIGIGQLCGTIASVGRGAHQIATRPVDTLCLVTNRSRTPLHCGHRGRESTLGANDVSLFIDSEISTGHGGPDHNLIFVPIPRKLLTGAVADAESLAGEALDAHSPAMLHLKRYLGLLCQTEDNGDEALLNDHIGASLLDLIALALGSAKDIAQRGEMRGVRAARVHEVIAAIRAQFADPVCTPSAVGAALGLSARYVQDLLHETGVTFSERVLEQRLQHARAMLQNARNDRLKINEIAAACGFNEISYFNRSFRRRYGETPGSYRAPKRVPD